MRILVANANTTQAVTDTVVAEARHHAAPGTEIVGGTGEFGVAIVSNEAENTIAGHAALDLLARHAGQVDAAVLAISFDTALGAAQELMPFPVVGMTAAALHTACLLGRRFGLITFGQASRSLYLELVGRNGLTGRMAGCRTLDLASAEAYMNLANFEAAVLDAARSLAAEDADSVVIAGAATAGMARRLQPQSPLQLLDGVACAVRQAELLVRLGARSRKAQALSKARPPLGLGEELASLLR